MLLLLSLGQAIPAVERSNLVEEGWTSTALLVLNFSDPFSNSLQIRLIMNGR